MLWRLARFAAGYLSYLSDRRILEIRGSEIRPYHGKSRMLPMVTVISLILRDML